MKKLTALLLALCLILSVGAALADETPELKDARSYINLMYKNKPASTPKDYEVVGSVPGENETFTVEWTADSDTIVITREESGMVKIDVNEDNPKEVSYKLTATIRDAAGNSTEISFDRVVPAAINLDIMTEEEIVAVAYTLEDGAPVRLAVSEARKHCFVRPDSSLSWESSGGASVAYSALQRLSGGALEDVETVFSDLAEDGVSVLYYYQQGHSDTLPGEKSVRITEEDFLEKRTQLQSTIYLPATTRLY